LDSIKLALIQLTNSHLEQQAGYDTAAGYIRQAAGLGTQLALLPELSGCGYIPNPSVWQYAEPRDGKTAAWACALSKELGLYIGAGFIETDRHDFYNSYLISSPQGDICGVIRKEEAESYCFKREQGDLFIDTGLGRLGIGICADNHGVKRLNRMKQADIDLMLMPHANPTPRQTGRFISEQDVLLFERIPYMIAAAYANALRVPVIYVNAVGEVPEFSGGLGVLSFNGNFHLAGGSLIVDAVGELLEKMDDQQGFIVCDIPIGRPRQQPVEPEVFHREWLHPGNALYRTVVLPYLIRKGIRYYNRQHNDHLNHHKGAV